MILSPVNTENPTVHRVEIGLSNNSPDRFSTLFAYGIKVVVPAGIPVNELFEKFLGIDPAYVEEQVQTILHDGKPLDDMFEYCINKSSTIALSAALPGLFGAAFRKGGAFSPLRQKAEKQSNAPRTDRPIAVTVKLFNMVAAALGPILLQRGIRISTKDFLSFLERQTDFEQSESMSVRIDGEPVNRETLANRLASGPGDMILTVEGQRGEPAGA